MTRSATMRRNRDSRSTLWRSAPGHSNRGRMTGILAGAALAVFLGSTAPAPLLAETFGPAIRVNDKIITQYELDQRARLLTALGAPGNAQTEAKSALIDERLEMQAADSFGFKLTDDQVKRAMTEFAGRTNLTAEQLTQKLATIGVDPQSLRDFVRAGATWQELIRAKYGSKVDVSEDEIDNAIAAQASQAGLNVAISEIFIPTGQDPKRASQIAEQISQFDSIAQFADAARKVSAAPSAADGGKVDWMPATKLPPALRSRILSMSPGEVTPPLQVQGALALFQLRGLRETTTPKRDYSNIEYMRYFIPGGHSAEAMKIAAQVKAKVDTCDDLYGIAKNQPAKVLQKVSVAPDAVPLDEAVELAKLDNNEVSTALTRDNGKTLEFLMLCNRTPAISGKIDRKEILAQLRNRQLASYADGYLAELRSDARIVD